MEDLITSYNYDIFIDHKFEQWMTFDNSPKLGQPAPDFSLTNLEGETVTLSEVWQANRYTVVEFGSLT